MPEEALVLPGIDDVQAPSTPDPAAPQSNTADDSASQSARDDASAEALPAEPAASDSQGDEGEAPPPKPAKPQKRFDQLTERARQAEARAQASEGLLSRALQILENRNGQQPQVQAQPNQPVAEPKRESFASYEEYLEARADWRADQRLEARLRALAEQSSAVQKQQSEQQVARSVTEAVNGARSHIATTVQKGFERFPDLPELIENSEAVIPVNVQMAMARSADPAGVAHYLLTNESVIARLSRLNAYDLGAAMTRIAIAKSSPPSTVSNAPPPGRPSGSRGSGPTGYRDDFTPEQHLEWEKRNAAR